MWLSVTRGVNSPLLKSTWDSKKFVISIGSTLQFKVKDMQNYDNIMYWILKRDGVQHVNKIC